MTKKIHAISQVIHGGFEYRVRIFWVLMAISILSLSVYIYAINATARNIALRQNLEQQISSISSNLATLEFSYVELKNGVTMELAHQYGYKEVRNPTYISRSPNTALTFNNIRR